MNYDDVEERKKESFFVLLCIIKEEVSNECDVVNVLEVCED